MFRLFGARVLLRCSVYKQVAALQGFPVVGAWSTALASCIGSSRALQADLQLSYVGRSLGRGRTSCLVRILLPAGPRGTGSFTLEALSDCGVWSAEVPQCGHEIALASWSTGLVTGAFYVILRAGPLRNTSGVILDGRRSIDDFCGNSRTP